MSVLATDAFTGSAGALGAQWNACTGETVTTGFNLDGSGNAIPSAGGGGDCSDTNNAVTWPNDQYSEVVLAASGANGAGAGCGVTCRAATGSTVTYYRLVGNASGYELGKKVAGSFTSLSSGSGTTFAATNNLHLEIQSTTLKMMKNAVQFGGNITDSSIASGRTGIAYSSTDGTTTIDSWTGGDFSSGFVPNNVFATQIAPLLVN